MDEEDHTFTFKVKQIDDSQIYGTKMKGLMIDSGATKHIVTDAAKFQDFDSTFKPQSHVLELADGVRASGITLKKGTARVRVRDGNGRVVEMMLRDTLYVPSFSQDIFSVKAATAQGATVIFKDGQNRLIHKNGVDFKMKTLLIDGIKVRIQIWDTAGQERYQTITKQYYRRAQGIFLVYDITSERSFQHIMKWASDVDEYAPDKVQKILVGNKSDDVEKRQVATEQGVKLAKAYGMDFFETSAFTNHNITESFTRLAEQVLAANKKDLDLLRISLNDELNLTALEEEEGLCDDTSGDQQKACWC